MLTFTALPDPWKLICQLLLAAVAILLVGGFIFNTYDPDRNGRMPKITELPQSFILIILAGIVWLTGGRDTPLSSMALWFVIGIAFGFLGDLFMANFFNQENHVLFGMLAFAIGHVFYMIGFREIAMHFDYHDLSRYAIALVICWVIAAAIWLALIRDPEGDSMQYAALVYALFLASMAGFALGLAFQQGAFWPLAIGAILFLFSDTLIGARIFAGLEFQYIGDVIWGTYITAQVLIVTAAPVALAL